MEGVEYQGFKLFAAANNISPGRDTGESRGGRHAFQGLYLEITSQFLQSQKAEVKK